MAGATLRRPKRTRTSSSSTVGVGVSISTRFTSAGHDINFDLVWPSSAIPNDFFPSNATFYGEYYYIANLAAYSYAIPQATQ